MIVIITYNTPSMEGAIITGACIAHMRAFTLHNWIASQWNRCGIIFEVDNPSLCTCKWPISLIVTASWLHSPKDSTTPSGNKLNPSNVASILMWSSLSLICHTEHVILGDRFFLNCHLLKRRDDSHIYRVAVCHSSNREDTGQQDKNWLQKLL